jgi:hypothetical protein
MTMQQSCKKKKKIYINCTTQQHIFDAPSCPCDGDGHALTPKRHNRCGCCCVQRLHEIRLNNRTKKQKPRGCTIYFQFISVINLYMFRVGLLLITRRYLIRHLSLGYPDGYTVPHSPVACDQSWYVLETVVLGFSIP